MESRRGLELRSDLGIWPAAYSIAFRRSLFEPDDVERVLPDVDADYGDRGLWCCRGHGVLLVWLPLASLSLAG
jgi:hypothetical protein